MDVTQGVTGELSCIVKISVPGTENLLLFEDIKIMYMYRFMCKVILVRMSCPVHRSLQQ